MTKCAREVRMKGLREWVSENPPPNETEACPFVTPETIERLFKVLGRVTQTPKGGREMEDYQQRIVDEKAALNVKQAVLEGFKASVVFVGLSERDRKLLEAQASYMQSYSDVLGERIARF